MTVDTLGDDFDTVLPSRPAGPGDPPETEGRQNTWSAEGRQNTWSAGTGRGHRTGRGREVEGGARVESTGEMPEIRFVRPMPGLGTLTRFALVSFSDNADSDEDAVDRGNPEAGRSVADPVPVVYELRSLEQPEIGLLVGVASAFFSHYEVELDDQTCAELELTEASDALVLVVLTVGTDVTGTTANLMAPVIINGRTRTAAQVILSGSDWPVRAPLG